jgi:hypothetical protein
MIRSIFLSLGLLTLTISTLAATPNEAKAALSEATKVEAQAFQAKSAWTATETALKNAQKALDDSHWDEAKQWADEAKALAIRSIEQANEQKSLWHNAVIR